MYEEIVSTRSPSRSRPSRSTDRSAERLDDAHGRRGEARPGGGGERRAGRRDRRDRRGRGFCAGADLNDLKAITEGGRQAEPPAALAADPGDAAMTAFRGSYTYIASIRKPVIAAINGPVAGMAVPIVLACDLRFASDRASFTTSFSRRGLVAEWGVSWLLPRLVGTAHALDLLFSARRIDADEAARIGLVNRVLPHDELLPAVRAYVEDLAANCSPASMAIMKRQVWQHWTAGLDAAEQEAVAAHAGELRASRFQGRRGLVPAEAAAALPARRRVTEGSCAGSRSS